MSRERYSYCFLRYHHDLVGGEFGNIGVLLWAPDSQFLGFRCSSRYSRLSKFFMEFDSDDYRGMVSRLVTQFDRLAEEYLKDKYLPAIQEKPASARELAVMVVPEDDGAIRWSRSQGGLTESPEVELEAVFERFINSKNMVIQTDRRDDRAVYESVYKSVFEDEVIKPVIESYKVKSELAEYDFNNAWKNGSWNVFETLSFDYSDKDRLEGKAFKWDSQVRHLAEAEEPPNIHLLLGEPRGEHRSVYDKAKDILASSRHDTGVVLVEEDEVADFKNELRAKVESHLASQYTVSEEVRENTIHVRLDES
jgi:hypothetical protein